MEWKDKDWNKLVSWGVTILGFMVFWPLGLVALLRTLSNGSLFHKHQRTVGIERGQVMDVPYVEVEDEPTANRAAEPVRSPQRERKRAPAANRAAGEKKPNAGNKGLVPVKKNWGRGLRVWGTILAVFGGLVLLTSLDTWPDNPFTDMAMENGLLAAGLAMLGVGISRKKRASRYRRYLSLIGGRDNLSIDALAEAMPVSYKKACADLQDMIEAGHLPAAGRLDQKNRRLLLSSAWEEQPVPTAGGEEPAVQTGDTEDAVLREIKELNDRIDDEVMSRKIDRIGEITAKILDYQRNNPDSAGELRSFLDYYLPTTLKLLRAYAQMEEQGVEGKNISEVKASVESAMDKVVDGFEKQLDKLFRADALDITSDIQVLEQMLQKDGLAADELLH